MFIFFFYLYVIIIKCVNMFYNLYGLNLLSIYEFFCKKFIKGSKGKFGIWLVGIR